MLSSSDIIMKMLTDILDGKDIRLEDIPDIDLYMDQVTTFIDNKLSYLKRDDEDKLLTKTMINNYSKSKVLLPSKNKKYDKNHMILLILIYYLKQILSINDIQTLFSPIFERIEKKGEPTVSLTDIYSLFLDVKAKELDHIASDISTKLSFIEEKTFNMQEDNKELSEMLLSVLMLVTQAYVQKRLAENIIDQYFKNRSV